MATTTTKQLVELIKQLGEAGWEVLDRGHRWRVTNPEGGGPLFVNKVPPRNNTLKSIEDQLQKRGWNPMAEAAVAAAKRQQKIEADRRRNEEALAEMEAYAAAQEAERAAQEKENAARYEDLRARGEILTGEDGALVRKAVIDITPAQAEEWLRLNNFYDPNRDPEAPVGQTNRPYSIRLEKTYAGRLLRKEWRRTHQGIAFDINGNLVDGQHRLGALVRAGETNPDVVLRTEVTFDLPLDAFPVIDANKPRGPLDWLAAEGYVNRPVLASAARLVYLYDQVDNFGEWRDVKLSPHQLFEVIGAHPGLVEAVSTAVRTNLRDVVVPSAASAGIYLALRAYPDAPMDDFIYGLRTGYDLPQGDARQALRDYLHRQAKRRRVRLNNVDHLALFLKTWNYWMMRRDVRQMRWTAEEVFPAPIEKGHIDDFPDA